MSWTKLSNKKELTPDTHNDIGCGEFHRHNTGLKERHKNIYTIWIHLYEVLEETNLNYRHRYRNSDYFWVEKMGKDLLERNTREFSWCPVSWWVQVGYKDVFIYLHHQTVHLWSERERDRAGHWEREREYEGTKPRKEKQLPSILGEKINLDQVRSREELQNKTNLENSDANIKKEQSIENGQDPPEMTCL